MSGPLPGDALDQLFREARTRNAWVEETLPEQTWRDLWDLMKFGPTSANTLPVRIVFVTSAEGKARLKPHLTGNNHKALSAAAIAIVGYDLDFVQHTPKLYHDASAASWFGDLDSAHRRDTAFRNGTLQGAYLIVAARALGLDCGPMSGFDNAGVDADFFAGTTIRSNFLVALGHGADAPFPRNPRLTFDEACQVV